MNAAEWGRAQRSQRGPVRVLEETTGFICRGWGGGLRKTHSSKSSAATAEDTNQPSVPGWLDECSGREAALAGTYSRSRNHANAKGFGKGAHPPLIQQLQIRIQTSPGNLRPRRTCIRKASELNSKKQMQELLHWSVGEKHTFLLRFILLLSYVVF